MPRRAHARNVLVDDAQSLVHDGAPYRLVFGRRFPTQRHADAPLAILY